jgi:ELWxxDGT repeat protein
MKKTLLLLLIFVTTGIFAQTPLFIQGPEGYGLEAPYTDRGMRPLYTDGNDLFALTTKKDPSANNMLRNYLVRINMENDTMHFYDYVALGGTADYYSPHSFKTHGNFIFFRCGWRLYKLDKTTNAVVEYLSDCSTYYIIGDYLIYDYWNSSKTYSRNMVTNVTTEIKAPDDKSIIAIGSIYEYNNEIYFWATVSSFSIRKNGIFKYNPVTKVLTSFMYVALQTSSNMYQGRTEVARVSDNLVFLIKDSTYNMKYVSVNLLTQTLNTNFTFDTNTVYDSGLSEPFVIGSQIYLSRGAQTYMSNGITTPVPAPFNFTGYSFNEVYNDFISYNGEVYSTIDTPGYGIEVWKTNGTVDGTQLVADLEPGPGDAFYIGGSPIVHGGSMYFCTSAGSVRIYKTDGTASGTLPLTLPGEFSYIGSIKAFANSLYFYGKKDGGQSGLYKVSTTPLQTSQIVCAEIFNDLNGNGELEGNEQGFENVNITITAAPVAFTYPLPYNVSTGNTGIYCFTGLPDGIYNFVINTPQGFEISNSGSSAFSVAVPSGNQGNTYRFGLKAVLSSEQFIKPKFSVYPNPAKTTIDITAEDYRGGSMALFDISGKKLHEQTVLTNMKIDVSNFAAGIYIIKLVSGDKSDMQKLIIE